MAYLNSTFGAITSAEFNIAGINRLALIEKAKLATITGGGSAGADITAITTDTVGDKFQEIFFAEDSATYNQDLVKNTSSRYINQTLNFRVNGDENAKAHSVILGPYYVALVKKNDGKWMLFGQTNGLSCTAATKNGVDEDANYNFTLTAKNLGFAANIAMTESELEALINSVTV